MKKLLILTVMLLVCTVAAWLGASWFIGVKTEEFVRQQLDQNTQENTAPPPGNVHTLVDYESTLFAAKATTLMNVRDTPLSAWVDEIQLTHEIKNGPLFWQGSFENLQSGLSQWQTRLDTSFLEESVREMVEAAFDHEEPLNISSLVNFDRMVDYQLKVAALNSPIEDGGEFSLEGTQVTGQFNAEKKASEGFTLTTDLLEFTNDEAILSLPSVNVTSEGDEETNELRFHADQVALLITGEDEAIRFNLNGKSEHQNQGEDLQGNFKLGLGPFSGMSYPLNHMDFDFEYEGLSVEGLTQVNLLQTRLQDIQAQLGWNEEEIETPEARRKIYQLEIELQEVAGHLLDTVFGKALQKDKSQLKYTLRVGTDNGDILNIADLAYAGAEQQISLEQLMYFGLEDWAKLFRGKVRVDVAQAALPEEFNYFLQYPVYKQALIDDGERYRMDLRLLGNEAELNDRVVAVNELAAKFVPQAPGPEDKINVEIPPDILAMIGNEGLTPEVMQQLEQSDDVSADALEILKQLQEMSEQLK